MLCFVLFCTLILQYTYNPIWNSFGDHVDYLHQSSISLFSLKFYAPIPSPPYSPRPFTIPLFFKLLGGNQLHIVWMQKTMHCLCVFSFISAILLTIKNKLIKIVSIPMLYYFFTWWPIVGFTENLLSESLSMSLLFLWLSTVIFCCYYKNKLSFISLIIVSFLFSFSRDTWPYIIFLANVLLLAYFFKKDKKLRNYFSILTVFSICVFFLQSYTSTIGERYKIPIYNVLSTRITKNPEYIKWFTEKGMPLGDSLETKFGNIDLLKAPDVQKLYDSYVNPNYKPLFKWILVHGKNTYILFMFSHPSYFFLNDQTVVEKERIFKINKLPYIATSTNEFLSNNEFRDSFSVTFTLILNLVLLILMFFFKKQNSFFHLPLFLIVLFTANALLSYNADTLEVERHLFITEIVIQLIFYITIIYLVDIFVTQLSTNFFKHKIELR
jgi:hypothetical protein